MNGKSLLVGIGSPHGDDAAGWFVVQKISERHPANVEVRSAQSPAELLDWLEGVDTLDVCDAVVCDAAPGVLHRWKWPDAALAAARFGGSHDVPLATALALAQQLGRLPRRVRVWGITAGEHGEFAPLSATVAAAIPTIVEEIWEFLHRA